MTRSNLEKIERVIDVLREIRSTLDLRSKRCAECGLVHYSNLHDYRAAQQLDGAIGRLCRLAENPPKGEENAQSEDP